MSKFIRFGDVLINYTDLSWVGVLQSPSPEAVLSFQFTNPANNFVLKYADRNTALQSLNGFESLVRNIALVYPLTPA